VRWERASSFGFSALVFVCQQKPNVLDRAEWFSTMTPNGHVYETFGISKYFPVKLQVLLIRAKMLDNALQRQLTIPHVGNWRSVNSIKFLSLFSAFTILKPF
jgi:hypothetical protein